MRCRRLRPQCDRIRCRCWRTPVTSPLLNEVGIECGCPSHRICVSSDHAISRTGYVGGDEHLLPIAAVGDVALEDAW